MKEVIIINPNSQYFHMGGKIIETKGYTVKVLLNGINEEVIFFDEDVGEVIGYSNSKNKGINLWNNGV